MKRDEEHAKAFLDRHQDKLMYGSDCNDSDGFGEKCSGAQMLEFIRTHAASKTVERKILFENAKRVLKLRV